MILWVWLFVWNKCLFFTTYIDIEYWTGGQSEQSGPTSFFLLWLINYRNFIFGIFRNKVLVRNAVRLINSRGYMAPNQTGRMPHFSRQKRKICSFILFDPYSQALLILHMVQMDYFSSSNLYKGSVVAMWGALVSELCVCVIMAYL